MHLDLCTYLLVKIVYNPVYNNSVNNTQTWMLELSLVCTNTDALDVWLAGCIRRHKTPKHSTCVHRHQTTHSHDCFDV